MLEGVDLVVAITVSWIPLVADYTRFGRSRSAAFWGTAVGYLLASGWLWMLGAILFFSRDVTDPAALPVAVAAGGLAAVLALLAVMVDETDEAFANIYSTAVSIQNVAPRLPQRALLVAVAAVATLGALTIDLLAYESFLILLGSFFVPLFGVLLADWLVAGRATRETDIFAAPELRWGMLAAWIAGFALYQWLHPVGPSWWVDAIGEPPDLGVGATLPSFVSLVARRRGRAPGQAPPDLASRGARRRGHRQPGPRHDRRLAVPRRRRTLPCGARAPAPRRQRADRRALRGGRPAAARLPARRARRALHVAARRPPRAFALRYDGDERAMTLADPGAPWTLEDACASAARGGCRSARSRAPTSRVRPRGAGARPPARARRSGARPSGRRRPARPRRRLRRSSSATCRCSSSARSRWTRSAATTPSRALGVPEIVLTHGSRGAVLAGGRREPVPVRRAGTIDPTGAGDAFLAAYIWSRAAGHRPLSAARHAASTTARVLELGRVIAHVQTSKASSRSTSRTEASARRAAAVGRADAARSTSPASSPPRQPGRPWSRSWSAGRRSSSPPTRAPPGARRAAASPPASPWRSTPTIPTGSSTPPGTGSTSRATAAASGGRSSPSCPTSSPSPG